MSDRKETLKGMINAIVYDNEDEARALFHQYVSQRSQEILGDREPDVKLSAEEVDDLDEITAEDEQA